MASKPRPYIKFYVSDFLTDSNVRCMNTEQVGAYVLLLLQAWTEEPCATLPDDDSRLARLAGLSIERWMESRDTVLAPFTRQSDGRIVQKRLRTEFEKMCRESNEKATNGKKGADARWHGHGTAMAEPWHNHGYSESNPDSDSKKTKRQDAPTRRKAAVAADPDWWGKSGEGRIQFKPTAREWRGITPQDYEHWGQAYPAVDVPLELRRMAEWIIANPKKGRKSEYRAFITRWLTNTQDKGGNRPGSGGGRLFPAGGSGHSAADTRRAAKAADEFPSSVRLKVL